ncbi:MAG: hypothetical protein D6737_03490 [Chloroflexi bacterium]|nr:MAG: hypothetical protein CUN54_04155 [Phototrophicales bacterium]RMF81945.1 MAG: hypothetical protein D6737_03490 [Chloroflexota bacterium]
MKRISPYIIIVVLVISALPVLAFLQSSTGVTAEAIGQANMRARADVNSALMGEIFNGTRYPVIGRHEFFPWALLGDVTTEEPIGWVFNDLLDIQGNFASVPFSDLDLSAQPATPVPTRPLSDVQATPTQRQLVGVALPTDVRPDATATQPVVSNVVGHVLGEINIRYGPGVEFPRVGVAREGESFQIIGYHTSVPWVEIFYPDVPNARAWVARDILEIEGDLFSLPAISQSNFALPTLTPTPPVVVQSDLVRPVPIRPEFQALGDQLWNMVLEAGFEPETSRKGALFLMDLQTGEALTFGSDLAFSGMSLTKIPILAETYRNLNAPPDAQLALRIGETMICSENTSTNALLSTIGNGDAFVGTQQVMGLMQQLGFDSTFIAAPYITDPSVQATPVPIAPPVSSADQISTAPDAYNQMTVDEMGALLNDMYMCSVDGSGPLVENFSGQFTQTECRQMLNLMTNNRIGELIEAGVPPNIPVAHKHGWIEDTHGDAGIVFTPGGNYILVMALHNPVFLDFNESFPLMAEISRTVYNFYNPNAPMPAINRQPVPDQCNLLGNPLIQDLMSISADG